MSHYKRIPELVVGALIAFSLTLIAAGPLVPSFVFEPFLFSAVLGTIFIGAGYTIVAYISARSFVKTAAPVFVLLGAATLTSAAGALAFWVSAVSNFRTTLGSVSGLESGVLMVSSAIVAYRGVEPHRVSGFLKAKLLFAYAAALLVIISVGVAVSLGSFPIFFVPGVGGTPLRQAVVAMAIILQATAAVIFFLVYRGSHQEILYWYPLAVSLLALGLFDGFFALYLGGILSWTGRTSVYLSGVYFLFAVLRNV